MTDVSLLTRLNQALARHSITFSRASNGDLVGLYPNRWCVKVLPPDEEDSRILFEVYYKHHTPRLVHAKTEEDLIDSLVKLYETIVKLLRDDIKKCRRVLLHKRRLTRQKEALLEEEADAAEKTLWI